MGDVLPGKGKNKYVNFLLYLANLEELKIKPKTQLIQEQKELEQAKSQFNVNEEVYSIEVNVD